MKRKIKEHNVLLGTTTTYIYAFLGYSNNTERDFESDTAFGM